jgi:hypothetical protein
VPKLNTPTPAFATICRHRPLAPERAGSHWYDLDRLAQADIAAAAVRDRFLTAVVAQIAAIALVHGLSVVTHNVKHFDDFGVEFFNPFKYQRL